MTSKPLATLGPRLARIGRVPLPVRRLTPVGRYYWNRGVNTSLALRPSHGSPRPLSVSNYYNAGVQMSYGNVNAAKAELGDLFNDIMGAVVPGWDQRPAVLKKIVVKPDPAKIMEAAQRIAPNAGANIVKAANANGLNVFVNTPAGQIEVTPYNAQNLYGLYPFLTRTQSMIGGLSPMAWLGIGAAGIGLFLVMKR